MGDANASGADIAILEGGLNKTLRRDIHDFNDDDKVNFYLKLAQQFVAAEKTGASYVSAQMQVRYGPISAAAGYTHKSAYIMRNAQIKYWVSRDVNGNIKIEIRAWDVFNVTPDYRNKDATYNNVAEILDPIHRAGGGNPNMQTRASWTHIVLE